MPIGTQFSTYDFSFDFKTAFFAAPRPIRSSRFLLRQSMHQQYFGPPRPSNNFSRSGQRDVSTAAKLNWFVSAFGNMTLHATLNASELNIAIRFDFNGARRMGCVRTSRDPFHRSMKDPPAPSYGNPNYCGFQSSDQDSNTEPCSARIDDEAIHDSASLIQACEREDLCKTFQRENMVISIPYGPIRLHPFLRQAQTEYGETWAGQLQAQSFDAN